MVGKEHEISTEKKEPVDYMDLLARAAEEAHDGDWTDLLPEQDGGKVVDYTVVAAAWEVQRARIYSGESGTVGRFHQASYYGAYR